MESICTKFAVKTITEFLVCYTRWYVNVLCWLQCNSLCTNCCCNSVHFSGKLKLCLCTTSLLPCYPTSRWWRSWSETVIIGNFSRSRDGVRSSTWDLCNDVITIAIRLRYDYDVSRAPASIWRERKWTCQFFVVVVSQSNRKHIVISIT